MVATPLRPAPLSKAMSLFKKLFLLLRVPHWSRGIFVLLGVIYAKAPSYWGRAMLATLAFCLVASAVYIYNDLRDIDEDKTHPQKSQRPLASGRVSVLFAMRTLMFLLPLGLLLGFFVSGTLLAILCAYLFINLIYNLWLRRMPLLDVLCIASGFMLRILAGTVGIGLPITWWLVSIATLLSLFIALCKRRLEMQLGTLCSSRVVLKKYSLPVLDRLIAVSAASCFFTYLFYAVFARSEAFYFMLTLPFCAIGLWRFTYLATKASDNDDPIVLFLRDRISDLNVFCFFVFTIMALW